jgi:hypothetical protein
MAVNYRIVGEIRHEVCGETKFVLDPPVGCLACEAYETVRSGERLDRPKFGTLLSDAGRNHAAALLYEAYVVDAIDDDVITAFAGPSWCAVEFPERALNWEQWEELFDIAQYTVDGVRVPRPANPLTLFRAAPYAYRDGHSWSESRALAETF